MPTKEDATIVEASIQNLAAALESGTVTAVDLVAKLLLRISTYDCRNTALNSIPLLNPEVFEEAALSDDRRVAGQPCSPLDGIPFTVKDSYKVKHMTVASGSEAFERLCATEDAFTVGALRKAGAILIGKTNMCPMAYGGMLRGVYGRAESPYNSKYLAAAFASGSSNGSGVSTAASFAAFGMGEETVSSGRSPASNNGLVAYTPSRGLISIRGNWPLYPTCDTVVPHTRSMDDLFDILDVITAEDKNTVGDFWRDQPFVKIPKSWSDRPARFSSIKEADFLKGKRIAVPEMYINSSKDGNNVYVSPAVEALWKTAKFDLEACGATVKTVADFPVIRLYEDPSSAWPSGNYDDAKLPTDWNSTERGSLIAHGWDDFLRINGDPECPSISSADPSKMFPQLPADDPQVRFSEVANAVHWSKLASYAQGNTTCTQSGKSGMYSIPNLGKAVSALENMRKKLFEDWMAQNNFDFVVLPATGDVGFAEADVDVDLAAHTWKNGVKYSHGNRAFRHLGIPSITVDMGMIEGRDMPMGLTILGKAYDDISILKAGFAYERQSQRRTPPPLTPALSSDKLGDRLVDLSCPRPELIVTTCSSALIAGGMVRISIEGQLSFPIVGSHSNIDPQLEIWIDAVRVAANDLDLTEVTSKDTPKKEFKFGSTLSVPAPPEQDTRNQVVGRIARDSTMVVVLARNGTRGRPSGCLRLLHVRDAHK